MRILDLQRRLREIGRIRIGEQVPTQRGGKRPAKLETFRLTSRDRAVVDAAAAAYGGNVTEWADSPDGQQWQVTTTASEMPVTVPPGEMSFSQAYEQWSAGGCRVRCDGEWDHVGDKACHCDPTVRTCAIHTRLSVILHDLPGLGVWRLDTSGYYAAVELGGVVDLAAGHAARGQMLPARLRLEQRSVKRIVGDKPETRRFAVPVLDLDVHPLALAGGPAAAPAIESGSRFEPVPQSLPSPPVAPVADQVPALGAGDKPRRRNAAAPIPSTGAKPRTAAEAAGTTALAPPTVAKKASAKKAAPKKTATPKPASLDDNARVAIQARIDELDPDERMDLGAWWKSEGIPALKSGDITAEHATAIHAAIDAYRPGPDPAARNKKMWAMVAEAWPADSDDDRDELRRHLIGVVSAGRTESSKELGDDEWTALFENLEAITGDAMELHLRSNGSWELRRTMGGAS